MFTLKKGFKHISVLVTAATMVFALAMVASADENGAPNKPDRIDTAYLNEYVSDTTAIISSPVNWDGNDWLKAALVAGTATGLYFADDGIHYFAQRHHSSGVHKVSAVGDLLGNPLFAAPSLGIFYLYGHYYDDTKARKTALLATESMVISGALATTLKMATQRPRPYTGESSTTWDGPSLKSTNSAFPSVHTQTAFSIASVVSEEYGDNNYVPPVAYGLATFVGLSRIADNKHWASDVFVGGALGYFVGKAVVKYHTVDKSAIKIEPAITQNGVRLMVKYQF